jgi:hypothetical protein
VIDRLFGGMVYRVRHGVGGNSPGLDFCSLSRVGDVPYRSYH